MEKIGLTMGFVSQFRIIANNLAKLPAPAQIATKGSRSILSKAPAAFLHELIIFLLFSYYYP